MTMQRTFSTRVRPRLLGLLPAGLALSWARPASAQAAAPNIVLILTDDMQPSEYDVLPRTRELIGDQGTTFPNMFCPTPLCSPSRTSLLTGQMAHNHGVLGNSGETGGYFRYAALGLGAKSIQAPLSAAGWRTGLIGKFLNGAPESGEIAPDWDELYAQIGHQYRAFRINENGNGMRFTKKQFATPTLGKQAVGFIEDTPAAQPLFLHLSPIAPHNIPRYPDELATALVDAAIERTADFNEADISDKPAYLRERSLLSPERVDFLDEHQRGRWRTLVSVDEMVIDIVAALEETGRLDNTYIFFLTDNGMELGHHRHVGKTDPYDRDVRTPLLVRGPGFLPGTVDDRLALNIDITATIAAVTGIEPPAALDGVSLLDPPVRDDVLIEWLGEPEAVDDPFYTPSPPSYVALRTPEYLYVEYETGERELYDDELDPFELNNLLAAWDGHEPSSEAETLAQGFSARLTELATCAGASCR
jgi:arylsulfatase A-like enzyme